MRAYLKTFWMYSVPLAWLVLEHLTMQSSIRLEVPFVTSGQAMVQAYGFPLPYQHESMTSANTFNVYLLPFLADLLIHVLLVGLLLYPFRVHLQRIHEPYRYGFYLFLWAWVLWTVFVNHSMDQISWLPQYTWLQTYDRSMFVGVPAQNP